MNVPSLEGAGFEANLVQLTDQKADALFWYEVGAVQTSALRTRFFTLWRAVASGSTNGAVVVVSTPSTPDSASVPAEALLGLASAVRQDLAALLAHTIVGGRPTTGVDQ